MLDNGLGVLDKGFELQCMLNKGLELRSILDTELGVLDNGMELLCMLDNGLKLLCILEK